MFFAVPSHLVTLSGVKSLFRETRDPDQLLDALRQSRGCRVPRRAEQVAGIPLRVPGFATFFTDLLELRLPGTSPYDAGMLFGSRHVGKAIVVLREARGYNQIRLATAIGVDNTKLSKYETGAQEAPEEVLEKIARFLGCEVIEILDAAYAIFRFNHLRVRAFERRSRPRGADRAIRSQSAGPGASRGLRCLYRKEAGVRPAGHRDRGAGEARRVHRAAARRGDGRGERGAEEGVNG